MTISRRDDLDLPFTTDRQNTWDKVVKTEVLDPTRDEQYRGEIDRTRQEEGGNQPPPPAEREND